MPMRLGKAVNPLKKPMWAFATGGIRTSCDFATRRSTRDASHSIFRGSGE